MIINREVILVKEEITYKTDPLPVSTDAVLVENPAWSSEGLRMNERPAVRASIGALQQVYGGALKTVTFDVELKGSGTSDTPPEFGALLQACGFLETINAGVSVAYDPASTGHKSVTIYYYQDGTLHILTGCRGTVSFAMEVGALGKASFTMTGHAAPIADAVMVAPSYFAVVPTPFINTPFLVGAFSQIIANLSFDMSNEMSMPPDPNDSEGFGEVRIIKRDINGTLDPEHDLVANNNFDAQFRTGINLVLNTGTIGVVGGNQYAITMPAIYYRDMAPGDRDGIRTLDLPFGATESAGDDEVNILFT